MPHVAVVILNWNGAEHLRTYLPSVVEHSQEATVIVADNGSTDDSQSVVNTFRTVRWLELSENYGFAEGYNRALAQVEAELYVLLNSDVRVTAGWLKAPLSSFRENPRLAAVQPKILADARPDHFEYAGAAGGYLDALGYPYCRGRMFDYVEQDVGQYDQPATIDWATGACCFVRSSAWHEVGGLDGSFFAHMEEIDLCWRLRNLGYTCRIEPSSVVYHLGGGTLAYASPRKTYLNFRNSLLTLVKNNRQGSTFLKVLARLILDGLAGLKFLLDGTPRLIVAILQAHRDFYRRLPATLRQRKDLRQRERTTLPTAHSEAANPLPAVVLWAFYARGKKRFSDL